MGKMVDVTSAFQQHSVGRQTVDVPQNILAMASGLSDRMGCSVKIKQLTVADDRYRLTLELSGGCAVQPRAESILNHLRQGRVILSRQSKTLVVQEGSSNFSNCCLHVMGLLNGLARQYHEIELIIVEPPIIDEVKAISAKGGKKVRPLAD